MECTARFWFIHFAVAQKRPDVLIRGVFDAAVMQVAVELCLVNCIQRAKAHRHSWELPKVIQHFWVRVGRQSIWCLGLFLTEAIQFLFGETAFPEGAGIVARGGRAL